MNNDVEAPAPRAAAPRGATRVDQSASVEPVGPFERGPAGGGDVVYDVEDLAFFYGSFRALREVTLAVPGRQVTAFIGPSGCGKTTFLRCLNRMNDLVAGSRVEGTIRFNGVDLYDPSVKPIELRRKVGMVFQKPNPFPKSIYDNIAFAPRANGAPRGDLDGIVEASLRAAALWDEVKDKLKASAFTLSGGQQQRLCIARAVAVQPEVILMDEPCASLDPIATMRIEELITELKERFTIAIVTHNLQQAARVADRTAFFTSEGGGGILVEVDDSATLFSTPHDRRTEDYITGRFG